MRVTPADIRQQSFSVRFRGFDPQEVDSFLEDVAVDLEAALKDMVSSPGGTSITGIAALEEGGIRTTFIKAVERATLRSRELGRGPA